MKEKPDYYELSPDRCPLVTVFWYDVYGCQVWNEELDETHVSMETTHGRLLHMDNVELIVAGDWTEGAHIVGNEEEGWNSVVAIPRGAVRKVVLYEAVETFEGAAARTSDSLSNLL